MARGNSPAMAMASEREKCVTGIEGLDNILGGGIPTKNIVLVTGTAGTGKTALAFEFLVRGAAIGENGLLITTVESKEKLIANIPALVFFDGKMLGRQLSIIAQVMNGLRVAKISSETGGKVEPGAHGD